MPSIHSALACVAIAILLQGCGHEPASPAPESLPTATVSAIVVASKERVATEEAVGTVRARLRAVIEAKASGRIQQMLAVPGQTVQAGDLLAELDLRETQARLEQARVVREQAESDLKRFTSLLEQKILSQSEYETARSRFQVADAAVREAETMLGYGRVVAPFDGVITRKYADVGDLAAPGKALLEMEDPTTLRLEADVPEAIVNRVSLGDRLPVRVATLTNALTGVVAEIAPAADPSTRTFLVKLDLPPTPGLRAGQFGRVSMPVGSTASPRVPKSAIVRRGQMELVFVVRSNRAEMRIVKSGKAVGDEIELVSGIEPGELVVSAGAAELRDGQPVTVKP